MRHFDKPDRVPNRTTKAAPLHISVRGKRAPRSRAATGQPVSSRVRPTERRRRGRDRGSLGTRHVHSHRFAAPGRRGDRDSADASGRDVPRASRRGRAHADAALRARARPASRNGLRARRRRHAARIKLRAHVDSIRVEITNPGLSTTTQAVVVEPSSPLRPRMSAVSRVPASKSSRSRRCTEALEACTQWRPDVIVSAPQLESGMAGIDLAYAMAEHATLSDVPLVIDRRRRRSRAARGVSRRHPRLHPKAVSRRGIRDSRASRRRADRPGRESGPARQPRRHRSRHAALAVRVRAQDRHPAVPARRRNRAAVRVGRQSAQGRNQHGQRRHRNSA